MEGQDILLSSAAILSGENQHSGDEEAAMNSLVERHRLFSQQQVTESGNQGYDADMDDSSILLYYQDSDSKPQGKKKYGPYIKSRKKYQKKFQANKVICKELLENIQSLVPGLKGQTDKAGVMEMTAEYVRALQRKAGSSMEDEFLSTLPQYSPDPCAGNSMKDKILSPLPQNSPDPCAGSSVKDEFLSTLPQSSSDPCAGNPMKDEFISTLPQNSQDPCCLVSMSMDLKDYAILRDSHENILPI